MLPASPRIFLESWPVTCSYRLGVFKHFSARPILTLSLQRIPSILPALSTSHPLLDQVSSKQLHNRASYETAQLRAMPFKSQVGTMRVRRKNCRFSDLLPAPLGNVNSSNDRSGAPIRPKVAATGTRVTSTMTSAVIVTVISRILPLATSKAATTTEVSQNIHSESSLSLLSRRAKWDSSPNIAASRVFHPPLSLDTRRYTMSSCSIIRVSSR